MVISKKIRQFLLLNILVYIGNNAYPVGPIYKDEESTHYPNYSEDEQECREIDDPYENFNRKVFVLNSFLDYVLLRPVAKSYQILIPDFGKEKVGNFVDNLKVPVTVINNILQLRPKEVVKGACQFIINTTVGIGGLFDVASKLGVHTTPQTFGSTLARYGVGPGPYIIVPIFGSTNGRDITDIFVLNKMDPIRYQMNTYQKNGVTAITMIHRRSETIDITDMISKESADPYAAIRSLIHQKRESTLNYPEKMKTKCKR